MHQKQKGEDLTFPSANDAYFVGAFFSSAGKKSYSVLIPQAMPGVGFRFMPVCWPMWYG